MSSVNAGALGRMPALVANTSFEEVYEANVSYVWRIVARLGVRGAAVEDLTQEVFLVVHRKLHEFEGRSSLRTWIFQIVRRVVRDHRRTCRRKEPHALSGEAPPDLEALPDDPRSGPHDSAAKAEAVRLLYDLLDKLDDDKREVFVLAELEQMPAPEIAEALALGVNTVYSRLRLAREAFNLALARHHARDAWRSR